MELFFFFFFLSDVLPHLALCWVHSYQVVKSESSSFHTPYPQFQTSLVALVFMCFSFMNSELQAAGEIQVYKFFFATKKQ